MILIRITRGGAVDCRAVLSVPLSASRTWGQIRDFNRFARQEFFHAEIDIEGGVARAGASLKIMHRYFMFRTMRVGRICRWKEGEGFAFSDLSPHGLHRGFPHVFSYRIETVSPDKCNVNIRVAGKWTTSKVPRWLARLWLRWIMKFTVQRVENDLLSYRLWARKKGYR